MTFDGRLPWQQGVQQKKYERYCFTEAQVQQVITEILTNSPSIECNTAIVLAGPINFTQTLTVPLGCKGLTIRSIANVRHTWDAAATTRLKIQDYPTIIERIWFPVGGLVDINIDVTSPPKNVDAFIKVTDCRFSKTGSGTIIQYQTSSIPVEFVFNKLVGGDIFALQNSLIGWNTALNNLENFNISFATDCDIVGNVLGAGSVQGNIVDPANCNVSDNRGLAISSTVGSGLGKYNIFSGNEFISETYHATDVVEKTNSRAQANGTSVTRRHNLNFTGAGVVVTDDAGNNATIVTFTGDPHISQMEADFGTDPVRRGRFTITDAAITAATKMQVWQAPGPYTGKGTRADEMEMDTIEIQNIIAGVGSAVVTWMVRPLLTSKDGVPTMLGRIRGKVKFNYSVGV